MAATTVNVTWIAADSQLNPVEGATITAELSEDMRLVGMTIAQAQCTRVGVTDSTGSCTIKLVPNTIGKNSTHYKLTMRLGEDLAPVVRCVVVPNEDCNVDDLESPT
jgi:hypothetical protein